eukprot:CAMPEP_0204383856 /NCGR_PEP_ID=MMETSP0469-20131031/56360_1 /ASSEMBLY_ACC=CAM_ASM_000384 /TAXON_ID=2969 /ORGANISM="Oxyrrhis marina" /LENGTH=35 /DNA_ID= /DNA_START= /DNA_END= /DNA_ORIENTATION=
MDSTAARVSCRDMGATTLAGAAVQGASRFRTTSDG